MAEEDPYLNGHLAEVMGSKSSAAFEKAARERDLKIETVADRKLAHFSPEFQGFVKSLGMNTPSMPFPTEHGISVIMVVNKRVGEPPKPLTRDEIKEKIESEKLSKVAAQSLTQLISKAHIVLTNPEEFPSLPYGKKNALQKTSTLPVEDAGSVKA